MKTVPSTATVELGVHEFFIINNSLAAAWRELKNQTPTDSDHALRIERDLLQLEEVAGHLLVPYRQLLLAREGK